MLARKKMPIMLVHIRSIIFENIAKGPYLPDSSCSRTYCSNYKETLQAYLCVFSSYILQIAMFVPF
jgi:hypothetical protein